MSNNNRDGFGSNLGFLMAAVGSAVGLGNIWGFPYKMGKSGGFTFLLIYVLLAIFVGFTIMMAELSLGRKTGKGAIGAYRAMGKKYSFIGLLAVFSPFMIMGFYVVLGGYCMEYIALNLSNLAFSHEATATGGELFSAMLQNPFGALMFALLFVIICYLINRDGVADGIEQFNKIGMPALFVMLLVIIVRSLSLPGAMEGLKFMFVPGYAVSAGFVEEAPSFVTVLATAGGQMFFSLSLAMGAMITYGSYLDKQENLVKNSAIIVFADTFVAVMAGIAVIPAAVANGIAQGIAYKDLALRGPSLLFITLQDVFSSMGKIGAVFGTIFYLLVLIAALSSGVALAEAVIAFFVDRDEEHGRTPNRGKISFWVYAAIMAAAVFVALDGLGSSGIFHFWGTSGWNDCALDLYDMLSEGLAMPVGALLMSLMVGWAVKPQTLLDEIHNGADSKIDGFFTVCIKFVVPVGMVLILLGQVNDFFQLGIF